ncbi:cell division protein FtsQ/DivIB [Methylosinus sp. Sm6]|nr:cell division protein FtsQ/DivIB [Methylosinus sp. Sm6]
MDGGRRVLRSLREPLSALFPLAPAQPVQSPAFAAPFPAPAAAPRPRPPAAPAASPAARAPSGRWSRLAALLSLPGVGPVSAAALFGVVGLTAATQNGDYDRFIAENGALRDVVARNIGFPIEVVTISGLGEMTEGDVLAASGVQPTQSLLFLNAEAVRGRLAELPLVESVRVLKLYPDRLVIALEGRRPFALWQRNGALSVIAADGMVIDEVRDERFLDLPFVVGEGAEKRVGDYARLLEAAGELKSRIRAGVLVSGRRWTLTMTNGVEVKLPESEPETALTLLRKLQREARILDKDILSVDLRAPGRVVARLSEEGAAARAAAQARNGRKGRQT